MLSHYKKKNNSGFTLAEVMVSLSLLLMFTGSFLTLLTQSYKMIFNAGHKSSTIYSIQKDVEKVHSQKSVDEPYEVVLNYSGGSKTVKGGLAIVESTEGDQHSMAQTFVPLAPMIELYTLDGSSEKMPAVFLDDNYNTVTIKISCVNFSYQEDSCSPTIKNVNGETIPESFYYIQNNDNLLNLTFNHINKPEVGTYTVFIKNLSSSFEAKGVFTVNGAPE